MAPWIDRLHDKITKLPNYTITQFVWLGACQFTGLMLRLTILLIFLSINNLKHNLIPCHGSPA